MKNYLLAICLMLGILSFGQKIQILSGNTDFLKDQKEINVKLIFDNVKFYDENKTEAEYLEKREKDVLENPKRGEKYWKEWITSWNESKDVDYLDKFIKGTSKSKKVRGTSGKNDFMMEYGRIASAYESTGKLLGKELN